MTYNHSMKNDIGSILEKDEFSKEDLLRLLSAEGEERRLLYTKAAAVKSEQVGKKVYYRGLIEFSNICGKNCLYCGIRRNNTDIRRYNLGDNEILKAAEFAYKNKYASVVLQSGELESKGFTDRVEKLLRKIKQISNNELGITISLGEQTMDVYRRWLDAGAHRYLLRIESSNPDLYKKIHPDDGRHDFGRRVECLRMLKETGYQTGTGIMVGLPFQTPEDIAGDIIFMRDFDIDMVGLGPYIEHRDTPMFEHRDLLLPASERFHMTLKVIALLRIIMKDINIAAATAMQAIDPMGREKALMVGANVIMPNITPGKYRDDYKLYENKPCTDEEPEDCTNCLEARIHMAGDEIGYGELGDSKHFYRRRTKVHLRQRKDSHF
jgi:biotin synthase